MELNAEDNFFTCTVVNNKMDSLASTRSALTALWLRQIDFGGAGRAATKPILAARGLLPIYAGLSAATALLLERGCGHVLPHALAYAVALHSVVRVSARAVAESGLIANASRLWPCAICCDWPSAFASTAADKADTGPLHLTANFTLCIASQCRLAAQGTSSHDAFMIRFGRLSLYALLLFSICSRAETDKEALTRATAAVEAATPRAQADPMRPIFHVTSPAQWVNDPNGPILHKGFYHLFYQLDPFSDKGGIKYWGHVRSRDLAKWEHLPIAIAPSGDKGEESIWSGCCTINGEGKPMIFYTSIAPGKSAFDHAEQWAATSDDDLIHWQKSPSNPVLSEALHGDKKIYDWRDPFVFKDSKKTFMVLGGHLEKKGGAVVNIYEAENPALTQWKYRGVMFQHPEASAPSIECPNFFKLGKQWVLFVSPYGKVQYFFGDFDAETCRFQFRTRGVLDPGNFYAPNTMLVPDGRRIVWGWVNGFPNGRGWNGCLTVPRLLSFSRDGQLRQTPAPQLEKLRDKSITRKNIRLENSGETFALPNTNTLEILAEIDLQSATNVMLGIKSPDNDARVTIAFDCTELKVMNAKAPLSLAKGARKLSLRIFTDRSVLEVFANDTVSITKVIPPLATNASLEIRADGGMAQVKRVEAWPMKTIW